MKIDSTVRREALYIAAWVFMCSVLLEAIFLIIGKWNYTVLTGNILSGAAAAVNFFLMGLTVQKAVCMEKSQAAKALKISQGLRTLFLFIVAAVGTALPVFNTVSAILPLFFPRIAILFRTLFMNKKYKSTKQANAQYESQGNEQETDKQ